MRKHMLIASAAAIAGCSPSGSQPANSDAAAIGMPTSTPTAAVVRSGPFGFDMGQKIEGLQLTKLEKPGYYSTSTPPKMHSDIESVVIEAYPQTGICMIRAIGKDLENDGAGNTVRGKVSDLADALATKYGKGQLIDACTGGDVQCHNDYWMMTLDGGERVYSYLWQKPTAQMKEAKIDHMVVAASATNISTSYAAVEYYSANRTACEAAQKSVSASSL